MVVRIPSDLGGRLRNHKFGLQSQLGHEVTMVSCENLGTDLIP
jgi:hypothetical protein